MELVVKERESGNYGAARVSIHGDLRAAGRHALDGIRPMIEAGKTMLTLELDGVTGLDSAGLRVLIRLLRYARERGGDVRVATANKIVRDILDLTALSRVFKLQRGAEAA